MFQNFIETAAPYKTKNNLRFQDTHSSDFLDLLFGFPGKELGFHNDRLLGKNTLSEDFVVSL